MTNKLYMAAVLAVVVVLLCLLSVVGSSGDERYYIENSDKDHVYLVDSLSSRVVVDEQIVDYQRSGKYLFILRMVASSRDCILQDGKVVIVTFQSNEKEYWAINTVNGVEHGPFDDIEFGVFLRSIGFKPVSLSVPKSFRPSSKEMIDSYRECVLNNIR